MANNTSVNVATAFRAAMSGDGSLVQGGRKEDFPPLQQGKAQAAAAAAGNGHKVDESAPGSSRAFTNTPVKRTEGRVDSSVAKKRKKPIPTQKNDEQHESERDSGEEISEAHETATFGKKGKKRAKVQSESDREPVVAVVRASPRRPRRSMKPDDLPYNPSTDPSFHPNNTSSSDEDSHEDGGRRRSRSKSKGGIGAAAIPRGIRDGEVWYGKGKKKRASHGGKSSSIGMKDTIEETSRDVPLGDAAAEPEDLGGMNHQEQDLGYSSSEYDRQHEANNEDDATPPAQSQAKGGFTTFFLRRKSASPPSAPSASRRVDGQGLYSQLQSSFPGPSLSPFRNGAVEPSPDPAFAAFDRSLVPGQPSDQTGSSPSLDDLSNFRNSSYDYSEEERLVQAIEAERRQKPNLTPQISAIPARTRSPYQMGHIPDTPAGLTPAPKTGAYPLTPGSPVQNLRRNGKNRLPAPPSALGQAAATEQGQYLREDRGEWGRKCGDIIKPLLDFASKVQRKYQDPLTDRAKILKYTLVFFGAVTLLFSIRYADSSNIPLPFFPPHPSATSGASSLYTAPISPPPDFETFLSRLSSLEAAYGKLSASSDHDRSRALDDRKMLEKVHDQIGVLERSTNAGISERKTYAEHIADFNKKIGGLSRRIQDLADGQQAGLDRMDDIVAEVTSSSKHIESLASRLDDVEKDVASATSPDLITQLAISAIEKKLPGKIGVRLDPSGRLEIDPQFWKHLKEAFVDKKDVEKTVDAKIKAFEKKVSSSGGFFKAKDRQNLPSSGGDTKALPSWDDFLAQNEESLRAWISTDLEGRTGGEAFVSKRTFLDLLNREIKSLKRDFETKANENFEQMGRELLSKVAKQEDLRKKDAIYAERQQQRYDSSSSNPRGGAYTIKSTDGQNVTAVISSLVDSALLRYSKDVLARPDYALFSSGGRVIRSLTSPTYEPYPVSKTRAALAWITGASAPRGRPAATALHPDTAPGSCWPFAGQQGQIGIRLSRRVVPSDITIEHISRDVALDGDVSSAPKNFEVWAVVEDQEDIRRLAQYRQQQLEAKRSSGTQASLEEALNEEAPASLPPSPNHLLISVGSYDPAAISPIQTFPITPFARQLAIPVQVVVVKILSNQGEPAYTCLYRIRISGSTETQQQI